MANKNLLVIYHSPCMDGYGAASAFLDQVNKDDWDSITFHGCGYGQLAKLKFMVGNNPLSGITHVLCLDICPSPETLDYMLIDRGLNVCVLDHHNTAMDNLEYYNKPGLLFTITEDYSGASLVKALGPAINMVFNQDVGEIIYLEQEGVLTNNDTYKYLNAKRVTDSRLFTLLEIRDLWIKDCPELKQQADDLSAYFKKYDFAKREVRPSSELEAIVTEALKEGREINAEQELIVKEAIAKSIQWEQEVDGEKLSILVGECPNELGSMFGSIYNESCEGNSLAIGTYTEDNRITGLSLRSKGNYGYARIVAEYLGGGGHDHSSGVNFNGKNYSRAELLELVKKALAT